MPNVDIITQAELKSVLEIYNTLGQIILGIRRRIEGGAAVEEGIYTADSNHGNPISAFDRAMNGIGMFGLDLETKGLPSDVYEEPKPKLLPNWVTETRDELSYVLLITDERRDGVDDSLEGIDLTRDEYIALKRHLAELRCYVVLEASHAN